VGDLLNAANREGTPDVNDWLTMPDHYDLFKVGGLFDALDKYIADANNGVHHIFVTGHSLGSAMVQRYMLEPDHSGDPKFEAITVAEPGYAVPSNEPSELTVSDGPNSQIINIHIQQDPATLAHTHPWLTDVLGDLIVGHTYTIGESGDSVTLQHSSDAHEG